MLLGCRSACSSWDGIFPKGSCSAPRTVTSRRPTGICACRRRRRCEAYLWDRLARRFVGCPSREQGRKTRAHRQSRHQDRAPHPSRGAARRRLVAGGRRVRGARHAGAALRRGRKQPGAWRHGPEGRHHAYPLRPAADLRGTWRDGVFKGTRYGPGGQKREQFEFSEEFPAMDSYSTNVRCEAKEGRYHAQLSLSVERGKLKSLDWHAVEPGGQTCKVVASGQQPLRGGLRFVSNGCRLTLRDAGELIALSAENCSTHCGAEAHLEPLLVDRRGNCELLRLGAR